MALELNGLVGRAVQVGIIVCADAQVTPGNVVRLLKKVLGASFRGRTLRDFTR